MERINSEMAQSGCEMSKHHRELILNNHGYLLHNLHPTEEFWNALMDKNLFSLSMIDEIKQHGNPRECKEYMLTLLPMRGPDAFDCFCDVLLECDHKHVAECLMMQEGTDKFRDDVNRYCATNGNCDVKMQVDKVVDIFQKIIPRIKHFLEKKFDLDIREQDGVFNEKEMELAEMEAQNNRSTARFKALDEFVQQMTERGEAVAREARRDYISRSTLREERKMLDEILDSAYEKDYADYANSLHTSLMTVIDYLESMSLLKSSAVERRPVTSQDGSVDALMSREPNTPATTRVDNIMECVRDFIEQISPCAIVDRDTVRNHLDLVLRRLKDVSEDMYYVREVFISTLQKKEEMTDETVSLVKNYKELQRLEREMAEKRNHILELRQQGKMIQKKGGRKPVTRQLEQCKKNIDEQKAQLVKIETKMRRQVQSADQRVRFILQLIPDREGNNPDELLLRSGASTAWDLYPEDSFLDIDVPAFELKRDPNETKSAPVKPDRKQKVVVAQEESSSKEKAAPSKSVVVQESNPERAKRESSVDAKPKTGKEVRRKVENQVVAVEETPRSSRARSRLKDKVKDVENTSDSSLTRTSNSKLRQAYGASGSVAQKIPECSKTTGKADLFESDPVPNRAASSKKRSHSQDARLTHASFTMSQGASKSRAQNMPPLTDRISALAMPRRNDNSPRRLGNCREGESIGRRPSLTVTDVCDFRVLTPENAMRRDLNLNRLTPEKDKPGTIPKRIPNKADPTTHANSGKLNDLTTKNSSVKINNGTSNKSSVKASDLTTGGSSNVLDDVYQKIQNVERNDLSRPSSNLQIRQNGSLEGVLKSRSSTPTLPYISLDNNNAYRPSSRGSDSPRRDDVKPGSGRTIGSARRSPSHDIKGDWRSIGIDVTSSEGGQRAAPVIEAAQNGRSDVDENLLIPDSSSVSGISARSSEEARSVIVLRKSRDVKSSPRRNALERRKPLHSASHSSLEGQVITEDVRTMINGVISNSRRSDVRPPGELGGLEGQPPPFGYANLALGGSMLCNQGTPRGPQRSTSVDERNQPPREILTTKKVKLG